MCSVYVCMRVCACVLVWRGGVHLYLWGGMYMCLYVHLCVCLNAPLSFKKLFHIVFRVVYMFLKFYISHVPVRALCQIKKVLDRVEF